MTSSVIQSQQVTFVSFCDTKNINYNIKKYMKLSHYAKGHPFMYKT